MATTGTSSYALVVAFNAPRQTAERSGASLDAVVVASESKGE